MEGPSVTSHGWARKILFVITSLDFGGAEAVVVQLATQFVGLGWQVGVVSMTSPRAYEAALASAGVELHSLDMRRGAPDPRGIFRLAQIFRAFEPDVVHAHMVHAIILARVTRLLAPVPALVSTAHTVEESSSLHYLGYRFTDWLSEVTTSVSRAGLRQYRQRRAMTNGRSVYLPNAVDLERFSSKRHMRDAIRQELGFGDEFTWVAVGRLTELKDYPNLLNAFALLDAGLRLWIVGDGELRSQVETLISDLELSDRVSLLGVRTDVSDVVAAADAFVLSSSVEGLPMALLEAAASALPVVATNVGGVADIVTASSGHLVPAKDHVALANAMTAVTKAGPSEREVMGQSARETVFANYDVTHVMAKWVELIDFILATASHKKRWAWRLVSSDLARTVGNIEEAEMAP